MESVIESFPYVKMYCDVRDVVCRQSIGNTVGILLYGVWVGGPSTTQGPRLESSIKMTKVRYLRPLTLTINKHPESNIVLKLFLSFLLIYLKFTAKELQIKS